MIVTSTMPAIRPNGMVFSGSFVSPAIATGLLREKLGFRGLIVSDDLEMGGALGGRSIGEAAVAAVEAGCQLLPVCRGAENIRAALRALLREL